MSSNGTDQMDTPAASPPPGVLPNFVDPDVTLRTGFLVTMALCLSIPSVLVLARLYTKALILKKFQIDDYALTVAWLGNVAWFSVNYAIPVSGRHTWDMTIADATAYLKYTNAMLITFGTLVFLAKLAILLQLKRIFARQRNVIWWVCQISIYVDLVVYTALTLLAIFQCWPRQRIWDHWSPERKELGGYCVPLEALLAPPGAAIVFSDIWVLVLPVVVIWQLRIAVTRKVAIAASFSFGLVSVVAAALEIYYTAALASTHDPLAALFPVELWAGVQLATLITAASIPVVPKLWSHVRGKDRPPPPSFERTSALKRIASFRRRRRNTLEFFAQKNSPSTANNTAVFASFDRPETPFEIYKTTELRVQSFRVNPHDHVDIGLAV